MAWMAPLLIASAAVALRPSPPPKAAARVEALEARPEPPPQAGSSAPPMEPVEEDPEPQTLDDQLERLMGRLRADLWLSDAQMAAVRAVVDASPVLSQGNPVVTRHPMTRAECKAIRAAADLPPSHLDPRCGAPNMVPIYDPSSGETRETAKVCIDQFEFPDIPCEYPVVEVRASEAAALCAAIGKRLCDAHEWEGACAGAVRDPSVEYEWPRPRIEAQSYHNNKREWVWSYGPKRDNALCGTMSARTPDCPGGGWDKCGSNTYPAGAFPLCKSSFGAYDFHGNAAEHMNLPRSPEELGMANGGGMTEMKGSWFVFSTIKAHEDDCRWRAPSWHETRVTSELSHRNYHLGFRCCKDVAEGR
jgi:formylglycine-generating enzyme